MATSDIKDQALKDIAAHLATYGPQEWQKVRDKYKEVAEPTWWRWVKKVRDGIASGESLATARKKIAAHNKKAGADDPAVAGALPVVPSPDYIARNGDAGMKNIDYLESVNQLYEDAMALRAYSLNDSGKIKIPAFFERSISSRLNVLSTGANLLQQVYDLKRIEAFHMAIIEEIGKESPELRDRVIARLDRLNTVAGFSYTPGLN